MDGIILELGRGVDISNYLEELWKAEPRLRRILVSSDDFLEVKNSVSDLLAGHQEYLQSIECELEDLERYNAMECLRVLNNFLSPKNIELAGVNSFELLWRVVKEERKVSRAFVAEFIYLFRGINGCSGIYVERSPPFLELGGRKAAMVRSNHLDELASRFLKRINSYPVGLDSEVIRRREKNRERVLDYFDGNGEDWEDYRWHMHNVVRGPEPLRDLIQLTAGEEKAVELASEKSIPFGITPYYVSLMDYEAGRKRDHAIRSQVIPSLTYIKRLVQGRGDGEYTLDFMREHDTSPVDLVTRRYPMIGIIKPYNTCAQICVYCQRNWEIDEVLSHSAMASEQSLERAIEWFSEHPEVVEVLITGGDPGIMSNVVLDDILERFAAMDHVERIRVGTRTPVVLPMRITDEFAEILNRYHELPMREVCLVTHFEHPYEVTPEAMQAVQKIRGRGMNVYNQQVFTMENSRRFETSALRMALKKIGVDPYYTFNAQGKEETGQYRVPIPRILQERKEEARVLPGVTRTDEPVFNVPGLGKTHLRAWEHHEYIMVSPRGERFYAFHPWEKNISLAPIFIYKDVPVLDYLERLESRGEDIREYRTIWYYF